MSNRLPSSIFSLFMLYAYKCFLQKANEEISSLESKVEELRLQARDTSLLRDKNRKLLVEVPPH